MPSRISLVLRGLVATDDDELAARVRRLKFHGLGVDAFDRQIQGRSPQAEVVEPGYKYNLSDIHAAIAVVQLRRLPEINARRQALVASYHKALAHLPLQPLALLTILINMPGTFSWCVLMKNAVVLAGIN